MINRKFLSFVVAFGVSLGGAQAASPDAQVQRGKYLVDIIPCTDCHTPPPPGK